MKYDNEAIIMPSSSAYVLPHPCLLFSYLPKVHTKYAGLSQERGFRPPVFGQTVNPISTRGADYAHQSYEPPPGFSDLATALVCTYLASYMNNTSVIYVVVNTH